MEIKIEIKKWFKLGFLDKIIKQIAFFDFYHFCEICDPRVPHHVHFKSFQHSFCSSKVKKFNSSLKKLDLHAVFFGPRFFDMKRTRLTDYCGFFDTKWTQKSKQNSEQGAFQK